MSGFRLRRRLRSACLPAMLAMLSILALGPGRAGAASLVLAVSEGPVSLPIYVAQALDLFKREGLDVRLLSCESGRSCFEMLKQQKADVATAAEFVVTLDTVRGGDAVIVATLSSSPHHMKLIGRKDAGIHKPADLRGKRIATVAGSSAEYFLDAWLVYHQIDRRDVHLVTMAPDGIAQALLRSEVDAVAIWEPAATQAATALAANALVLPNPRVYTQHFGLVTSRQAVQVRKAELVAMLRALAKASRVIVDDPARAKAIWRARFPAAGTETHLPEHDFTLRLPQSLIATMEGQARWAEREGYGRAPDKLLPAIEPALLRQVVPGAVELD